MILLVNYIYEQAYANLSCCLNMADQFSTSDDCINSEINSDKDLAAKTSNLTAKKSFSLKKTLKKSGNSYV